jgi:hypothetical protein
MLDLNFMTFDDLRSRNICRSRTTLAKFQKEKGFPAGRMIGRHRIWTCEEIREWVEAQPEGKAMLRGAAKRLASVEA